MNAFQADTGSDVTRSRFSAARVLAVPAGAFLQHWPLYLYEGAELALFMISACCFTVWLFDPAYPAPHLLPGNAWRRLLMGVAMGATAILIIHSPMGKRSGAHFNPAITMTYLRLGKIAVWDAVFYAVFQFLGGAFGVAVSASALGAAIAVPAVDYAVTVPGTYGPAAAFFAELFMATLLMGVVLWTSNRPSLAVYTSYLVGILIMFYILLFAPVSGFSINPARTTGSAVLALLCCAPSGNDDGGGNLPPLARQRQGSVRKAASRPQPPMPFSVQFSLSPSPRYGQPPKCRPVVSAILKKGSRQSRNSPG
jgi:aquaporin Z